MGGWVREPVNVSLKCFDMYARRKDPEESGAGRAPEARVGRHW